MNFQGLTSHLARALQQVKKKQEDLQKEKQEMVTKLGDQLKRVEEAQELSKRGVNAGKRIILETAVRDDKVMQDFELESFLIGATFPNGEGAPN